MCNGNLFCQCEMFPTSHIFLSETTYLTDENWLLKTGRSKNKRDLNYAIILQL